MNKDINIRQYRNDDKDRLLQLLQQNTPLYFDPQEEADFVAYLDQHIDRYFVIEYRSQVVGCGGYNLFDDHAKISWDIISTHYQRRGLGKLLLTYRIQQLKQYANIKQIVVRTSQHVYRFYESNGFVLQEIKIDYWASGYDLYKLEMSIK